ncbi:MAG: amidohydrolase family protein [Reyranella sp.]|jgi:N-acyl-D-aspartate/D-glutamate deacylase|uniref:N-acyl-D-amino-acid deacylase family protein n=1 Tax=Reyranella sp. TaxID=1929291 RepID=UPI0025F6C279|nr:amidohydrolase family protein [Reyranella sp.]MBR2819589.1 amidohydrolase family protein [Reyranella sp.]
MFDLVIKDAEIHDGSGARPMKGDLGVSDGRITAIGPKLGAAKETVEARGLALAPGIIDGHTHYDAQITWDPFVDPSPALGVTTAVLGNCGFTIAPCKPQDRDLTMRHLTHVEGMSLDALRAGIRWEFESFPQYLDMLEKNGVGPNVACFAGHSALRTFVMGTEATERAASDAEIAAMADLLRGAMQAGAVGFASSTSEAHNGEGGTPMPSRLADDRELRALIRAMSESGKGVYMLTKGSKTTIPYLEEIAAEAKRPVVIAALFHSNTNPNASFDWLRQVNEARARGRNLVAQTSCCPLSMDFTFKSPYLFESMQAWKPAMAAHDPAELETIYRDPAWRASVRAELEAKRGRLLFNGEWHKLFVVETAKDENRTLEGAPLDTLARQAGKDPLDYILDLALSEKLDTTFVAQLLHNDDDAVGRILADPHTHISLSDAGAHLTFFCDAGFGLHLMGHWSRDLGVLDLPQAVHRLTGQPASLFGIEGRGLLREGYAADLMLFDPATVARGPKRRAHDLPAGAARLTGSAVGLHGVWINGSRTVDEKGFCADPASRPGQVLRRFAA